MRTANEPSLSNPIPNCALAPVVGPTSRLRRRSAASDANGPGGIFVNCSTRNGTRPGSEACVGGGERRLAPISAHDAAGSRIPLAVCAFIADFRTAVQVAWGTFPEAAKDTKSCTLGSTFGSGPSPSQMRRAREHLRQVCFARMPIDRRRCCGCRLHGLLLEVIRLLLEEIPVLPSLMALGAGHRAVILLVFREGAVLVGRRRGGRHGSIR